MSSQEHGDARRAIDLRLLSLQQIIDERISFLKEQINPQNKAEVNKTFQIQMWMLLGLLMILKKLTPS